MGEQWDKDFVGSIRGTPKQPVPGVSGYHIPTYIGGARGRDEDVEHRSRQEDAGDEVRREVNKPREEYGVRRMYVTKGIVNQYGQTEGCPGCKGRAGAVHIDACRERVTEAMKQDGIGRIRISREEECKYKMVG